MRCSINRPGQTRNWRQEILITDRAKGAGSRSRGRLYIWLPRCASCTRGHCGLRAMVAAWTCLISSMASVCHRLSAKGFSLCGDEDSTIRAEDGRQRREPIVQSNSPFHKLPQLVFVYHSCEPRPACSTQHKHVAELPMIMLITIHSQIDYTQEGVCIDLRSRCAVYISNPKPSIMKWRSHAIEDSRACHCSIYAALTAP